MYFVCCQAVTIVSLERTVKYSSSKGLLSHHFSSCELPNYSSLFMSKIVVIAIHISIYMYMCMRTDMPVLHVHMCKNSSYTELDINFEVLWMLQLKC